MKFPETGYSRKIFIYLSLFWIGFGLFTITSSYVYFIDSNTSFDWPGRFISRMPVYLLWIIFIPLITTLVSKHKIEAPDKLKNIAVLLVSGVIISAIHRVLSVTVVEYLEGIFLEKKADFYAAIFAQKYALFAYMFDSFIMYGIIISILLGIEYYMRYNQNRVMAADLEKKLALAEVSALKMQINPHFLFNMLHSISALIHKNPDEADQMICLLSDLLRISLNNSGKHFVPLRSEIDFVKIYLDIQKLRYKGRLTVQIDADARTMDFKVPNLILQPVVENSIKHVLEKNVEKCTIIINCSFVGADLELIVKDNGKGIDKSVDLFSSGLGLSNIKSRLDQLYGSSYELKSDDSKGDGLEMKFKLPVYND